MFNRLKNAIKKYGVSATIRRCPRFIRSRIKKLATHPSLMTRFGITRSRWEKFQIRHELDFWNDPAHYESLGAHRDFREKYFHVNKNKFQNLRLDFPNGTVIDVGCGPNAGFLPFATAARKLGVDPLAKEYSQKYPVDKDILMIASMAEDIPLLPESVDACFCVNALDHMMRPYKAMNEMYRVLKKGGYFAFSADIGGTKKHPVKILKVDLDTFFQKHPFQIIEQRCSTDHSAWGKDAGVPLYTFQGYKL